MADSALSRLFPVKSLAEAQRHAAPLGLTIRRDPDCSGLFLIHEKGKGDSRTMAETLAGAMAWAAAWASVAQYDSKGAPYWGWNEAPGKARLAAVMLAQALNNAGAPTPYLAEVAQPVAVELLAMGRVRVTLRAGLAAWGRWPEWLAEESIDLAEFAPGDAMESRIAEAAETLAARIVSEAAARVSLAAQAGDDIPRPAFPDSPEHVPPFRAEEVARAALAKAQTMPPRDSGRVALAELARALFIRARGQYAGHGRRDRMERLAAMAESVAAEIDPAEGMQMGAVIVSAVPADLTDPELGKTEAPAAKAESNAWAEAAETLASAAEELRAGGAMAEAAETLTRAADCLACHGGPSPLPESESAMRAKAERWAAEGKPQTIDVTPEWAAVLPMLLAVLESGTAEGRKAARAELGRMAEIADGAVKVSKATRAAEARAKAGAVAAVAAAHDMTRMGAGVPAVRAAFATLAGQYATAARAAADLARTAEGDAWATRAATAATAARAMAAGGRHVWAAEQARFARISAQFSRDAAVQFALAAELAETLAGVPGLGLAGELARTARAAESLNRKDSAV